MLFRKNGNIFAIAGSYILSRLTHSPFHMGKPLAVSIEPTNHCNLRCPECPSGNGELTRRRGKMDLDFYKSILDQLAPSLLYLTLYFEGEPFLHPDFLEMVSYAKKKKIYVSTSTNGHFLTEPNARRTIDSGLDRLIVSVDGADQASYEQYRKGGNLDKVLAGIQTLNRVRKEAGSKKPKIILQTLLLKTTENDLPAIKRAGLEVGADKVIFKSAQFNDFRSGHELMPATPSFSRYKKNKTGEYEIKNPLPDYCFRMWSSCVVTWDGIVVPCCFDKDATHAYGNLYDQDFHSVWTGKKAAGFRKLVLSQRKKIDICINCSQTY